MIVRQTRTEDLPEIMKIYDYAKQFMVRTGNPNQWNGSYPEKNIILQDIEKRVSYVCEENGVVVGTFAFIIGEDPTYQFIENGEWSKRMTYGTIHRLAGNGKAKGVARVCFDYCKTKQAYLRGDTHEDNKVMQENFMKNGFRRCGIIYLLNGDPRIAYDYCKEEVR